MIPAHKLLFQKARDLASNGKADEAVVAYREFLRREPKHAEGWAYLAAQLWVLGQLEEARKACDIALRTDPQNLLAQTNLGYILAQQGQFEDAETLLRIVLAKDATRMDARLALASCLIKQRKLDSARKCLHLGILRPSAKPHHKVFGAMHAEMWALLGGALLEEKQHQEAEQAIRTALRIDPRNRSARANMGCLLMRQGDLEDAEVRFRKVLAEDPSREDVRLELVTCLAKMGNLVAAEKEILRVIQQAPNNLLAHRSLVGTYYSLGRWDERRAEIERYRQLDPSCAEFELSLMDLLFGEMPRGWERYEARWRVPGLLGAKRDFPGPAWNGEAFTGKTLLLHAEQGFGDTLMFARYIPRVKALGGRVILETQLPLLDVARTCKGVDEAFPQGASLPPFDLHASLLSLPWLLRTELHSIPAEIPYLDVPQQVPHKQAIAELLALAETHRKLRIGLVWAGNPDHKRDAERSIPAKALAPLAILPGVAWFSFQFDPRDSPPLPNLVPLSSMLGNFSDTAYALSGMDLVISVDTALAHLSGALGIPTLLLLAYQPDFRWLLGRDDSPWYPTMRLYRQPTFGDWGSVVQKLVADLNGNL